MLYEQKIISPHVVCQWFLEKKAKKMQGFWH